MNDNRPRRDTAEPPAETARRREAEVARTRDDEGVEQETENTFDRRVQPEEDGAAT